MASGDTTAPKAVLDAEQPREEDAMEHAPGFSFAASRAEWGSAAASKSYARSELEALRLAHAEWQQRWWAEVYRGLNPAVARDYDGLRHEERKQQQKQRAGKKKEAAQSEVIVGENEAGSDLLLFSNVSWDENFIGNSECMIIEEPCDEEEYEDESSSDEYDSIQRPAFYVEGEPDFESGPPLDGVEYLRRVRWEAAQIPKVKVAKLNLSELGDQTPYMPDIPDIPECPANLLPSKQWEDAFLADFSEIRETFFEISLNQPSAANEENPCKQFNCMHWPKSAPTMSAVLSVDAVSRAAALRNCIKLFETAITLSKHQCLWLFALCVAVDTPLLSDTSASLRCLLRKCSTLLAEKLEPDEEVAMLNMLVAISGKYFGQSGK